jgi:hypothetical protein
VLALIPRGEWINYRLQLAIGSHSPQKVRERVTELLGSIRMIRRHMRIEGATVVEVGTGWDAIGAIVLHAAGANAIHTFDHLRHARLSLIRVLLDQMRLEAAQIADAAGVPTDAVEERLGALAATATLDELLERGHIRYVAPGDAGQTELTDRSVDLVFSFAVMEHVPESVITALNVESQRILKRGGIAYHLVGLGDHYQTGRGYVNFLRYPEWLWRILVKNKFSYHNRLRGRQFIDLFKTQGAHVLEADTDIVGADLDHLKSIRIDPLFAGMTPDELAAYRLQVVLAFE